MSDQPTAATDDLRCASWSRAVHLDPVGTAGAHRGYLLVDLPLPWPVDIGELDEVAALRPILDGTGLRIQARVPEGPRRVALYRFPEDGAPAMAGSSVLVDEGPVGLATAAQALLAGGGEAVPAGHREVLLCTHGRRDLCCGSRGAALHVALTQGDGFQATDAELRRTSHTGGHRFAPTAIVLPEATGWAYLDPAKLRRVLDRRGPVEDILGCYRGWSGLPTPSLQALERAVLAEEGWSLLGQHRSGHHVDGDRWALTVGDSTSPTTWVAEVRPGRRVPRPDCGQPAEGTTKQDVELVVSGLRSTTGASVTRG